MNTENLKQNTETLRFLFYIISTAVQSTTRDNANDVILKMALLTIHAQLAVNEFLLEDTPPLQLA